MQRVVRVVWGRERERDRESRNDSFQLSHPPSSVGAAAAAAAAVGGHHPVCARTVRCWYVRLLVGCLFLFLFVSIFSRLCACVCFVRFCMSVPCVLSWEGGCLVSVSFLECVRVCVCVCVIL